MNWFLPFFQSLAGSQEGGAGGSASSVRRGCEAFSFLLVLVRG